MSAGPAKRILIAPLDWGLGHTTRCIPIIRRLLEGRHEVIFAGNDLQQTFAAGLFPQITLRHLPGYNVTYGRGALMPALLRQLPGLIRTVRREHAWLLAFAKEEQIDGIISDNRYGLWHPQIPCVILTHQPEIKTGIGQWADRVLRRIHYRYLLRFSECLIVDVAGKNNLAGSLSHPLMPPRNARYIGWLSQLVQAQSMPAGEQHLLILLSGPEPQRTMLADALWAQACALQGPVVFVEGAASAERRDIPAHITHHGQVAGATLQALLEGASIVVCRSGYSTLMDLMLLRKKAILIPTPGQTEQEYLARTLAERGMFFAMPQKSFSLALALAAAGYFPFHLPEASGTHEAFKDFLDGWVRGPG